MRQKRRVSLSVLAAIGLIAPIQLYAFGLGPLSLNSKLNQPFDAEIEITSLTSTERNNLFVRLAPPSDFERAGLERHFFLTLLNFEVVDRQNQSFIHVTSPEPIKEPFLDFLISASAGEGRMIRAYTVLLDPPTEVYRRTQQAPSTINSTPVSATSPRQAASVVSASTSTRSTAPSSATHHRVKRDETLWRIANTVKPQNVTAQQMMVALFEANPTAFQHNNMNGLLANVQLNIPDAEQIAKISQTDALARVSQHIAQWPTLNQPVATQVAAVVTEPESVKNNPSENVSLIEQNTVEPETTEAPLIALTDEDSAANDLANTTEDEQARLKLLTADELGLQDADPTIIGLPELQKLVAQLSLAQETIEAQSQENIDFKARMDALEEQIETMRRLLSLQDSDMARLQQLLQEDDSGLSDAEALAIMTAAANQEQAALTELVELHTSIEQEGLLEHVIQDPVETDEDLLALMPDEQAGDVLDHDDVTLLETTYNPIDTVEGLTEEQFVVDSDSSEEPIVAIESQSVSQPTMVDRVISTFSNYLLPILVGGLAILLLVWAMIRRRQTAEPETVVEITDDEEKSVHNTVGVTDVPVSETVVIDDGETIELPADKTVAELVEQADLFVGYADYVQAGSALEQALEQQPEDKVIATKLLYVLFKQQRSADFLALVSTIGLTRDDVQWDDVAAWGHTLMPANALFAEVVIPDITNETDVFESEEDTLDLEVDLSSFDPIETEVPEKTVDVSEDDTDAPIEFNLDGFSQNTFSAETQVDEFKHDQADFLDFPKSSTPLRDADIATELESNTTELGESEDELLSFTSHTDLDETVAPQDDWVIDLNIDDVAVEKPQVASTNSYSDDLTDLTIAPFDLANDEDPFDVDFDLGDFDQVDEAETKLELAHAYIELEDADGARNILEEVLNEGSDEQKQRAQDLLNGLS